MPVWKNFYASRSLDKGLVTEVTSEDKLLERAEEIAADFVEATSSLSVTLIRQMLWKMLGADHPMEAHKIDSRGVYSLGKTGEASEGVMSFRKERPNFPGRVSKDLPDFTHGGMTKNSNNVLEKEISQIKLEKSWLSNKVVLKRLSCSIIKDVLPCAKE